VEILWEPAKIVGARTGMYLADPKLRDSDKPFLPPASIRLSRRCCLRAVAQFLENSTGCVWRRFAPETERDARSRTDLKSSANAASSEKTVPTALKQHLRLSRIEAGGKKRLVAVAQLRIGRYMPVRAPTIFAVPTEFPPAWRGQGDDAQRALLAEFGIALKTGVGFQGAGQIGWAATDDHHDLVLEVQTAKSS